MARATYELISDDSTYVSNMCWIEFVLGLEAVILKPDSRCHFKDAANVTELGIETGFAALKRFFAAFYEEAAQAEIYRMGITEYSGRYNLPDLDAVQIKKEIAKFNPYPSKE